MITKINDLPLICGLEIASSGKVVPTFGDASTNFNNSTEKEPLNWVETYFTKSKVKFSERSKLTRSGDVFYQTLTISNNNNAPDRANRIQELLKLNYIKLQLSSGRSYLLGRNDYNQNTKPKVTITSGNKQTKITITTQSITPTGFFV